MIDIEKARRETPGCERVFHFNNAGASLMPQPVIDAVTKYFNLEVMSGGHEAAILSEKAISRFYQVAAGLIHALPEEIAFIECATRAWDMIFYALKFQKGDRIVTAEAEYGSNYIALLQRAKQSGVIIEVIPNDTYGQLSLQELEKCIDDTVKLIAITHVPTQGGLINPVEEVGAIARKHKIFYLLDATQSIGQMPVDVKKIGCDALCATGRKFLRGPRGSGFLYVNAGVLPHLEPPFLDGHAAAWVEKNSYVIRPDARRFETWEKNYSNLMGLTAAIDYALNWGIENIWERILELANYLRDQISSIPGITLQDLGRTKCGIVTFTAKGMDPQDICFRLRSSNINVSVSSLSFARLDLETRGLTSVVRSSVHYYNTKEEIAHFCRVLEKI